MKVIKFYHKSEQDKLDIFLDQDQKSHRIFFITDDDYATRIYYVPIKQSFAEIGPKK